jgi:hypothetical protein
MKIIISYFGRILVLLLGIIPSVFGGDLVSELGGIRDYIHKRVSDQRATVFVSRVAVTLPHLSTGSKNRMLWNTYSRREIIRLIREAARKNKLDPVLLIAVAIVESDLNPNAISPRGAIGVMQLMPTTAQAILNVDPYNTHQNIEGGALYLKNLIDRHGLKCGLAAYNAGSKRAKSKRDWPGETVRYVQKILNLYNVYAVKK